MKIRMAFAVVLMALGGTAHAQMNALPQARHILVYGQAQARAIPDRFKIQVSFDVVDTKADVARGKVETMMRDTLGKLRAAGVPDGEIIATSLQIEPRNEYNSELRKQEFKGMGVERSVTATFDDQANLKKFLAQLETSEQLIVSGVTTSLSTEDALKSELRAKTIESTKRKAEVIAKSYGARITGLYSVSDTAPKFEYGIQKGDWPATYEWASGGNATSLYSVAVYGGSASAAAAPPPESFQAGYVNFNDTIYAVFLIGD